MGDRNETQEELIAQLKEEIKVRKETEKGLRESLRRANVVWEQAFQFIGLLTIDGTMVEVNQAPLDFGGIEKADVLGKPFWDAPWFSHSDDLRERIKASIVAATNGEMVRFEEWLMGRNGSQRCVDVSMKPVRDESRTVVFVIPEGRDITERKKMEGAVRESERRVRAINKELEAFAYSVSHDLRAPLRSIDGFSQVLLEDYADVLDELGKDYLARVRAGSQKMGKLIDDLLKLSQLTRGQILKRRVDLSVMTSEIVAELQEEQPDREVEVLITSGLVAEGDEALLQVALKNLIGNSWKFTGNGCHAKIEFGSLTSVEAEEVTDAGRVVYFVRDNGAGFDMSFHDKLFGAFQRLHRTSEFPGTGIGLATVERIIRRHGGRVWGQGSVGEGATFFFTLGT